jgi:hypothetical protein
MNLLCLTNSAPGQLPIDPASKLSIEACLAHAEIQPLTDIMVEIILFQLRERALFADIDMPAYCLN